MKKYCLCVCLLALVLPASALAETEFFLGVGGGVATTPYRDYDTQWFPMPVVGFENDYVYIRGVNAGVKLINLDFLQASLFAGYDGTSYRAKDSSDRRMRLLRNRHASAVVGLDGALITPYGLLHANVARDILGRSEGFKADMGYAMMWEMGDLELMPGAGVHWSSSRYNDYYYGVSKGEALRSGFSSYDAGAGFSPYLNLNIDYTINDRWEVFCYGELTFLSGAIKDSPMVNKSRTGTLTLGVLYNFN